jgi:mannonate dehydratase
MFVSGAMSLLAQAPARRGARDQAGDIKLAHRLNATSITDDDLLFLQQIGLTWVRLEFPEAELSFDALRAVQERFALFNMRIFSVVHPSYRSLRVQLGQPGRDQDIEIYRRFLRNLGRLEIPVASYDFHPANTYTTSYVQRRGYTAREFDLNDFRTRIEKQAFEREYSGEDIWSSYTYFMKAVLRWLRNPE